MALPREPTLALELAIATPGQYPAIAIARLWKPNSARRDCLRAMLRLLCPAICTFLFPRRRSVMPSNSSTFWAINQSSSRCRNSYFGIDTRSYLPLYLRNARLDEDARSADEDQVYEAVVRNTVTSMHKQNQTGQLVFDNSVLTYLRAGTRGGFGRSRPSFLIWS